MPLNASWELSSSHHVSVLMSPGSRDYWQHLRIPSPEFASRASPKHYYAHHYASSIFSWLDCWDVKNGLQHQQRCRCRLIRSGLLPPSASAPPPFCFAKGTGMGFTDRRAAPSLLLPCDPFLTSQQLQPRIIEPWLQAPFCLGLQRDATSPLGIRLVVALLGICV